MNYKVVTPTTPKKSVWRLESGPWLSQSVSVIFKIMVISFWKYKESIFKKFTRAKWLLKQKYDHWNTYFLASFSSLLKINLLDWKVENLLEQDRRHIIRILLNYSKKLCLRICLTASGFSLASHHWLIYINSLELL